MEEFNEEELLLKALGLRKEGKLEEALDCFDKIIDINPVFSEAYVEKARTYEIMIEKERKQIYLEEKSKFKISPEEGLYLKMFIATSTPEYQEKVNERIEPYVTDAIENYEKALKISPEDEELFRDLLDIMDDYLVIYGASSTMSKLLFIWEYNCGKNNQFWKLIYDWMWEEDRVSEDRDAVDVAIKFCDKMIDQIKNSYNTEIFEYEEDKKICKIKSPFEMKDEDYNRLETAFRSKHHFSVMGKKEDKFKGNLYEFFLTSRNPYQLFIDLDLVDYAFDGVKYKIKMDDKLRKRIEEGQEEEDEKFNAQFKLFREGVKLITNFIRRKLKKKYGEQWWEEGVAPIGNFKIDSKAMGRKRFQLSKHPDQKEFNKDNFGFLDIKDYAKIICYEKNWELFKDIFSTEYSGPNPKQWITSYLKELGELRNQLLHALILLKEYQVDRVKSILGAIQECIRQADGSYGY